jgi:hypothetical protein
LSSTSDSWDIPAQILHLKYGERAFATRVYERHIAKFSKDRPELPEDNRQRALSSALVSAAQFWFLPASVFGYPGAVLLSFSVYLPAVVLLVLAALCIVMNIVRFIQARHAYPALPGGVRRRPTKQHPDIYA